jgi:hypothetical protein
MKGAIIIVATVVVFVHGTALWCLDKTNTLPVSPNRFEVTVTYKPVRNNKGIRTDVLKPKLIIKKISHRPTSSGGSI